MFYDTKFIVNKNISNKHLRSSPGQGIPGADGTLGNTETKINLISIKTTMGFCNSKNIDYNDI